MTLIEDYYKKGIDYSELPEHCPAVADERMRRDYFETGMVSSRDMEIVLGDQSKGISISPRNSFGNSK